MAVNRKYIICAGMIEEGESIEECIQRELYEENRLTGKKDSDILKPSFQRLVFLILRPRLLCRSRRSAGRSYSDNEEIEAAYTKEEVLESRNRRIQCQSTVYSFVKNFQKS